MNARITWTGSLAAALLCTACTSEPLRLHDGRAGAGIATISMPEELELASVNGVEIEGASGMWTRGEKTLEVVPGRYELLTFYREIWQHGDQHDVLRSDPARFVVEARAGGSYRLDYARPQSFDDARRLAAEFKGWSEDMSNGSRSDSQPSGLGFRRGLVASITADDTLVPVAGRDGRSQQVAPLPESIERPAMAGPGTDDAASSPPPEPSEWLLLMQGWWSQASAEERRDFLLWLSQQH